MDSLRRTIEISVDAVYGSNLNEKNYFSCLRGMHCHIYGLGLKKCSLHLNFVQ